MGNGIDRAAIVRLWALQTKVNKLVMEGRRDPVRVADVLQKILQEAKPKPSLLSLVGTVTIPATTTKFVARDKFVVNTKQSAKVKIIFAGGNFATYFLSGDGEIEDPLPEQTLCYHKLLETSLDDPIIKELGGEDQVETTLGEMFSLIEKQGSGEEGVLLNNGRANIFYIIDQTGVLRAVDVGWRDVGWDVGAVPVDDPRGRGDGYRVFSRQPVSAAV